MSGIGYVREYNKLGMVRDDYKLDNSLNRVTTHECGTSTKSDMTKVKSVNTII